MGARIEKYTLSDDTAQIISLGREVPPITIWANPGAGSTVAVSYSLDSGVTYTAWPAGAVTAAASDVLTGGVTHIKFQQTVVAANSTVGVC